MKTKKNGSSKPLSAKPQNKLTFDALVSKDIEAEIVLNKIADFANLKISIEEFLRLSFIEIGKLKWVCKSCKYSIYLLDEDKTKLTLAAHKHLSKRELKKCEFIPLIKKAARALEKPGIKTNGNLINEISKHLDINKKTHANRYLINIKHNHQILGIIHVATKDDLMKNEVAGKFIAAFTTLAAETILRKKDEAARIFEKEANDSLAELATMFLSSNKISTEVISNMVVKKAQELTKSKFAFISYLDPHEGHMVIPTFSESVWQKCRVKEKSKIFTNFKDIWSHLLKIKKPILSNNPKTNSFSNGAPKGHVTIENYIAVPAVLNNKLIGLIAIANTKHNYDEADLTYLKRLANFYAITLSRKFEAEKLKYAEEKYRSIIESNNNLIYTINPEGIITFINHNAKNYGYKPEEVIGKHMSKFCHRDDLPLAYTELKKLLKTGKSSKSFIIRFKRKDGSFYYGEQRSGVIYKNGKIEATISNMHDITERKTMQDRIKENEKTLQIIFDTAT
ncbi:MAG: PAS domain S-box protein, partial [Elusimicrobiota bacterium]|nr:PAS domain S-box protein [Elusimicrobiota bacterium]